MSKSLCLTVATFTMLIAVQDFARASACDQIAWSEGCQAYERYLNYDERAAFKVFMRADSGEALGYATMGTFDAASRIARDLCEEHNHQSGSCRLFAVGNTLIWHMAGSERQKSIANYRRQQQLATPLAPAVLTAPHNTRMLPSWIDRGANRILSARLYTGTSNRQVGWLMLKSDSEGTCRSVVRRLRMVRPPSYLGKPNTLLGIVFTQCDTGTNGLAFYSTTGNTAATAMLASDGQLSRTLHGRQLPELERDTATFNKLWAEEMGGESGHATRAALQTAAETELARMLSALGYGDNLARAVAAANQKLGTDIKPSQPIDAIGMLYSATR